MKVQSLVMAAGLAVVGGLGQSAMAQYCAATSNYTTCSTTYEYIARVQFNTIDNASGCDTPATGTGGYEDYSAVSTTVIRGTTNTLTVTVGTPWAADRMYAWVDWNNDFNFDPATEQYVLTENLGAGNSVVSVEIPTPTGAALGPVRMRVRLTYNLMPQPCGQVTFGQIEDYTLNVTDATTPLPPSGSGSATPASVAITGQSLLRVNVQPGLNPSSTGLTVRGNLTSINGGANQQFYDDGTHGDVAAGDNVFSYLATMAEPLSAGPVTIPFTVSDAQARQGTGNISMTLLAAPSGACCTGSGCQVLSAYACTQGGGSYSGNGTACDVAPSGNAYSSIAGTGTMLSGVSNCDDCVETLAIPFTFNFYGQDYTSCTVSSNANIQFSSTSTSYTNNVIPGAAVPNNAIYPLWDDMNPLQQGDIFWQLDGVSPNQTLTIEWANVTQYTAANAYPLTSENFQVVLHEGTNDIEFRYGAITPTRFVDAGQSTYLGPGGDDYTIGIEDVSGTMATWIGGAALGNGNTSIRVNSNTPANPCSGPSCPGNACGTSDYNGDGDFGTDQDIEAFFACVGGTCCPSCFCQGSDFNGDGDFGTDQDIEAFFRVLGGNNC